MKARKAGAVAAFVLCVGVTLGCAPRATPEQQVRAVVAAGEAAAENRDHRALMALVSSRFTDDRGGDVEELAQHLRAYLMSHPALRLATRIEDVQFPYDDMARARVTVGTLSTGADDQAVGPGANLLDLAADLHSIELELQREGNDWKVTRAQWTSLGGS